MGLNLVNSDDIQIEQNGEDISLEFTPNGTIAGLMPVVLYENSSGTNENIILNDDVSNYQFAEVFYRTNDNRYGSVKIENPDGKAFDMIGASMSTNNMFIKYKAMSFSQTSLTIVASATLSQYGEVGAGTNMSYQQNNYIYITKVLGYKGGN